MLGCSAKNRLADSLTFAAFSGANCTPNTGAAGFSFVGMPEK
jgi:hypothetical protein